MLYIYWYGIPQECGNVAGFPSLVPSLFGDSIYFRFPGRFRIADAVRTKSIPFFFVLYMYLSSSGKLELVLLGVYNYICVHYTSVAFWGLCVYSYVIYIEL